MANASRFRRRRDPGAEGAFGTPERPRARPERVGRMRVLRAALPPRRSRRGLMVAGGDGVAAASGTRTCAPTGIRTPDRHRERRRGRDHGADGEHAPRRLLRGAVGANCPNLDPSAWARRGTKGTKTKKDLRNPLGHGRRRACCRTSSSRSSRGERRRRSRRGAGPRWARKVIDDYQKFVSVYGAKGVPPTSRSVFDRRALVHPLARARTLTVPAASRPSSSSTARGSRTRTWSSSVRYCTTVSDSLGALGHRRGPHIVAGGWAPCWVEAS